MITVFSFLLFQGVPHKGKVYYWADGNPVRRITSREDFIETVGNIDHSMRGEVIKSIDTYSFYIYSTPDKTIKHLPPRAGDAYAEKDSVMARVMLGAKDAKKDNPLGNYLAQQGFHEPTEGLDHLKRLFQDHNAATT